MPDVVIECPTCGKSITVSEFVDLTQLACRDCGTRFTAEPADAPAGEHTPPVSVDPTPARPAEPAPEAAPVVIAARVSPKQRKRFRWSYQLKCWLVFVVVGAAAALLRYGAILGADTVDFIMSYGWLAVLALHLHITLTAFRDSILSGLLCLLVPFYSLYYVFWSFEDYMFRAVFGGILVGTGADTLGLALEQAAKILPAMDDFFTSGL
jgi:hypothetical protein